jgi:hypothetical protein
MGVETHTRTQAGADLDRTALTLSPATTRRHTPRPHHRGGTLMTNREIIAYIIAIKQAMRSTYVMCYSGCKLWDHPPPCMWSSDQYGVRARSRAAAQW